MAIRIPQNYTADLRGKQSVRATFKLTKGCISAISIVATHLGIKQKSLFDHLVEDDHVLESIAREIKNAKLIKQNRVQKTYVISRRSLYSLDEVSKNYNAPRDALVEYLVQQLIPVIQEEREKHEKRKAVFSRISKHFKQGVKLLEDTDLALGKRDPLYDWFESAMTYYKNTFETMDAFIEKGKIIENFDPERMRRILLK